MVWMQANVHDDRRGGQPEQTTRRARRARPQPTPPTHQHPTPNRPTQAESDEGKRKKRRRKARGGERRGERRGGEEGRKEYRARQRKRRTSQTRGTRARQPPRATNPPTKADHRRPNPSPRPRQAQGTTSTSTGREGEEKRTRLVPTTTRHRHGFLRSNRDSPSAGRCQVRGRSEQSVVRARWREHPNTESEASGAQSPKQAIVQHPPDKSSRMARGREDQKTLRPQRRATVQKLHLSQRIR